MATSVQEIIVLNAQGQPVRQTVTVDVPDYVVNDGAIRDKAAQALAANVAYLAIGAPTNAQVVAQVARLTRECTALIRLVLNQLDTTDGA